MFFRSLHMLPDDKQTQVRAERRALPRHVPGAGRGGRGGRHVPHRDISADIIVHYYLSAVNQLGSWFRPDGALTARQVAEQYAELLLGGLRT